MLERLQISTCRILKNNPKYQQSIRVTLSRSATVAPTSPVLPASLHERQNKTFKLAEQGMAERPES